MSPHDNHPDAGDLALRALGETLTLQDSQHLSTCHACQSELDEITAIVTAARSITPEDRPSDPPGRVWEAIAAEALGRPAPQSAPQSAPARTKRPRNARWWQRVQWPGLLVGATAGVAVFAVGGVVVTNVLQAEPADIVASTGLEPLPTQAASGTAEVVSVNGARELTLDVSDLPQAEDSYFEVWLLAEDVSGMVSLGTLGGSNATLAIPDGVDLAQYPVVDVSIEPFDGDPTHSKNSLVRGTFAV